MPEIGTKSVLRLNVLIKGMSRTHVSSIEISVIPDYVVQDVAINRPVESFSGCLGGHISTCSPQIFPALLDNLL